MPKPIHQYDLIDFIRSEKEKTAHTTQDILCTKQLLDKAIAKKNKISIAINQTALERVLKTAEEMSHTMNIEGKTIAELREHYIIAVKNLFVELEFPIARVQPVIGRVVSRNTPQFFPNAQNSASAAAAAAVSDLDDILREIRVPRYPIANAAPPARASRYVAQDDELGDDSEYERLLS